MGRPLIGLTLLLGFAVPARAQILWNQPSVASIAVAQAYAYTLYVTAPGGTTPTTVKLASVQCATTDTTVPLTAMCQAPVAQVAAAGATVVGASSQLTATDLTTATEGPKSLPFVMTGCPDPMNVSLVVGTWTRTIAAGGVGQVLYSLLQSKTLVTSVEVQFNGQEQDLLQGTRLNHVAGSYFTANVKPGSYQLTVQATDGSGCTAGGATRPMTVVVQ